MRCVLRLNLLFEILTFKEGCENSGRPVPKILYRLGILSRKKKSLKNTKDTNV